MIVDLKPILRLNQYLIGIDSTTKRIVDRGLWKFFEWLLENFSESLAKSQGPNLDQFWEKFQLAPELTLS